MAMRTWPAGALSRGLLGAAMAGVMAVAAACGGVRAEAGGHPSTIAGSAAASAGGATASAGSATASAGSATTPASRPTTPAGAVPLCANAAHLNRMVVSLSPGLMLGHVREALPRGVTITDPARVHAVAVALCGLPVMPATHLMCPEIHAGIRLTFYAAGRVFPPVLVETAGCQLSASGLGPVRAVTGAVVRLLRRDLGYIHPVATPAPMPA